MKLLFLPIGMVAILFAVLVVGCAVGLAGAFVGTVVGLGVGLGGLVIGGVIGLFRLGGHLIGPLLVVAGILLLVKIADRA